MCASFTDCHLSLDHLVGDDGLRVEVQQLREVLKRFLKLKNRFAHIDETFALVAEGAVGDDVTLLILNIIMRPADIPLVHLLRKRQRRGYGNSEQKKRSHSSEECGTEKRALFYCGIR